MDGKNNGKHILMIAPTPFFADRGCHVRILEEALSLKALGYRVTICTYHLGANVDGIETRRSLGIPWYSKISAGPSLHKFYVDVLLLWTVVRTCLESKPDIIHAHLHEGVVIGKIASLLFGVPLVADLQGSLAGELLQHHFIKKGGLLHWIFYRAECLINRMSDATLLSSTMYGSVSSDGRRGERRFCRVVHGGVDTERFHPASTLNGIGNTLGIPPGVKVVGFVGVLTDYQGVVILLEAIPYVLKETKAVHFLIMGYPSVEYYQERARLLGIVQHVTFTGRVPYTDLPGYLEVCDVSVAPKLLTTEANGKLLNYMAMGLPVVASDIPVSRELLGPLGVYAEVGDPRSLANALLRTLSDEKFARALGAKLREKAVAEYSRLSIGKKIVEVYCHLTREQGM